MNDHPVLYETTTYAVEQKAVHSSSSYYSTSELYHSTSAYSLPARRDSPEYLRITNQVVSHALHAACQHARLSGEHVLGIQVLIPIKTAKSAFTLRYAHVACVRGPPCRVHCEARTTDIIASRVRRKARTADIITSSIHREALTADIITSRVRRKAWTAEIITSRHTREPPSTASHRMYGIKFTSVCPQRASFDAGAYSHACRA